jgi:hypothetical protein
MRREEPKPAPRVVTGGVREPTDLRFGPLERFGKS